MKTSEIKRLAWLVLVALACVAMPMSSCGARGSEPSVAVERAVKAKMRDGNILRADIYRPADKAKHPVLLERTPYDRQGSSDVGVMAASRGFIYVAQDVRGRFGSDGDWYPFANESNDGYDTVEWAAALPGSDGRVGMLGASYVGATQLLAAVAQPPHLAGIFPILTASNYYDGWTYRGGALQQWFAESWSSGLSADTVRRNVADEKEVLGWSKDLPVTSFPVFETKPIEKMAPYFHDWLAHPSYDDYWKRWAIDARYSKINLPATFVGGWYDIFLDGTLRNFVNLSAQADSASKQQRLIIGPWIHGPFSRKSSDVDFGATASADLHEMILSWYQYLFLGEKNARATEKPVRIFVMGRNEWREEESWPLARAQATRFFLHSSGAANSSTGNGSLSTSAPAGEPADKFVYDSADPVPTRGGGLCCIQVLPSGAFDQREIENRKDVLVYTIPAFAHDTEVTGPIDVELFASSSAVDTDFTAKLVDVWPNGYAQNLSDGIIRARYRNSLETPEFMKPGQIYKFTIHALATSNVFLAGHAIRVEISSSNFPHYGRNLNTSGESNTGAKGVRATNTIYHDAQHPSAVILPVIP